MKAVNISQLAEDLNFECLSGKQHLYKVINSAYVSDLLSDVIGKAQPDMLWITSQVHKNIIAVALLKDLCAIVLVNERVVEKEVLEAAEEEGVVILSSGKPAFETSGAIYKYLNINE